MHAGSSLYFPRRHRRRLLFPPGLLALAGLLLIGSVALEPWQEALRPKSVLQLTLPVVPSPGSPKEEFGYYLPSPAEAQEMGPWLRAAFTGEPANDRREQTRVATMIRTMSPDTGVRVSFSRASQYRHLVFVIDQLQRGNLKRYWVDMHNRPVTINALKVNYRREQKRKPSDFSFCGTASYTPPTPFIVQAENKPNDFPWAAWLPLLKSEWRAPMWLLAAIAMLSGWHLVKRT